MSKSMTATAIMQLVEEGSVMLTSPVVDVLPEFVMVDPRAEQITVEQLLTHTSGLSKRDLNEFDVPGPGTPQEAVAELSDRRLTADPGSRFEYMNTNYYIAARIVEYQSGQAFDEYLNDQIFAPLAMTDTMTTYRCNDSAGRLPRALGGILWWTYPAREMPGMCGGSGGVISTAADMAIWMQFNMGLLDSSAILSPESLAQIHQMRSGVAKPYGLGWFTTNDDAEGTRIQHAGGLTTWSSGMAFDPQSQTAAVVLVNRSAQSLSAANNLVSIATGGTAQQENGNSNFTIDAILLALILITLVVLLLTIVRAPKWASKHRESSPIATGILQAPLVLAVILGVVLPIVLMAVVAGVVTWQAWLFVGAMPLVAVLAAILIVGGIVAVARRYSARRSVIRAAR